MRFPTLALPFLLLSCFFLLSLPTSTNALGANVCVSAMLNLGSALNLTGLVRAALARLGVDLNIRICLCLSAGLTDAQQRQQIDSTSTSLALVSSSRCCLLTPRSLRHILISHSLYKQYTWNRDHHRSFFS